MEKIDGIVKKVESNIRLISNKCEGCGREDRNTYEIYYEILDRTVRYCSECSDKVKKKANDEVKSKLYKHKCENTNDYLRDMGVSARHLHCSLDNFTAGMQYTKFCKNYLRRPDKNILLTGVCGCGKTHLAVGLGRELIKNINNYKMKFITAPDLLLKIRQGYNRDGFDEDNFIESYSKLDFLFLDDLGAEKTTEHARATFYLIIDRRDRELKPTIVTSNLSPSQIAERIDERIASRLAGGNVVKINLPDFRLKRQ